MTQQPAPMLAVDGEPFDSSEHLFEIKWDGVRCLAGVEHEALRLWGRGQAEYTSRYPELDVLRHLPERTILDGELVHLRAGRADFSAVLRRHQTTSPRKIRWAAEHQPVSFMVFDLLQFKGQSLLRQPLGQRRTHLRELLDTMSPERPLFSQGVTSSGTAFFDAAVDQQHEGVMAKRLDSAYLPGKRNAVWQKIKPRCELVCVIIGFCESRYGHLRSLMLAAEREGTLRFVGPVRRGLGRAMQHRLAPLLNERRCAEPVVPCTEKARWVRPELYGRIKCFGWTPSGRLRFPCFVELLKAT